jgi:hypothetical protein
MAGNTNKFENVAYSLSQPLTTMAPYPIVAKRAPTVNDINYPLGQEWIYSASNAAYILTSVLAGAATWIQVSSSGGSGTFASLVVTPGPASITGTTSINTSGAAATTIGNSGATVGLTASTITLTGKIAMPQGTGSASVGITAAMVAGTTTVATTAVTSNSRIFVTANSPGGTQGILSVPQVSITPGVSFVINSSSNTDTSTCNWLLID